PGVAVRKGALAILWLDGGEQRPLAGPDWDPQACDLATIAYVLAITQLDAGDNNRHCGAVCDVDELADPVVARHGLGCDGFVGGCHVDGLARGGAGDCSE